MNQQHSDDEILAGLRRRMSDVEPMIPALPAWKGAGSQRIRSERVKIRGRLSFGGLVPLVLVTALVVVAVGFGLGSRNGTAAGPTATPKAALTTIVYQLMPTAGQSVRQADLDETVSILRARLIGLGSAEPLVEAQPPDRISVTFGTVANLEGIRALLGRPGVLQFIPLDTTKYGYVDPTTGAPVAGTSDLPPEGSSLSNLNDPGLKTLFGGDQVDGSSVGAMLDPSTQVWAVELALKPAGTAAFSTWSSAHVGNYFMIVLDNEILSVPYIKEAITTGTATISGAFTAATAQDFANVLKYGALPMPIREVSLPTQQGTVTEPPMGARSVQPSGVPSLGPTAPAATLPPIATIPA